ncbi:MAG: NAD(P)H-dependent oxidoreductase [Clostridia bacterium]|nr:NAD(P)H-dependent oxidoreductase [Clostridia bacterium]
MKITVINGTEKHGITYKLKEIFLENFRDKAEITEFCLPKDLPDFCTGCTRCHLTGEENCKDAVFVQPIAKAIDEADLLVFTSPSYVFHVTGAMKACLDHLSYRWMPHRPSAAVFSKRAVIITQCLGSGAKSAAKDIKHSLSWWGISDIKVFCGKLMSGIVWNELPEKTRRKLELGIKKLSGNCKAKPARAKIAVKIKFYICRMIQKSLYKKNPEYNDAKYWHENGWLDKKRPWKRNKSA